MERLDKFTDELFHDPTFPLLYITETSKLAALASIGETSWEAVGVMAVTSIPTTLLWYHLGKRLNDAVDEKVEEAVED